MSINTSVLLDDYFDEFISKQIKTGRFSSASEVIRAALRLFEHEENKKRELIKALEKGEDSGFISGFNRDNFQKKLHQEYAAE